MIKIEARNEDQAGCPRMVSFPIGVPPNAEDMVLELSHKVSGRGKRKRQVVTTIDGLVYRGSDVGDFSMSNNTMQWAIGRLDETTGVMTIVPADHAFIMRPELEKNPLSRPPRLSSLSASERREMRTDEFGSRKKKRALQVAASNTISAQNISGADVVESAMTTHVKLDDDHEDATEKAIAENRALYLPKFNADAQTPQDIYPVTSLIPSDVNDALEQYCEQIFDTIAEQAASSEDKKHKKLKASQLAESFSAYLRSNEDAADCVTKGLRTMKEDLLVAASTVPPTADDKQLRKKFKKSSRQALLLHFMVRFHRALSSAVTKFKPDAYKKDITEKTKAPQAVTNYLLDNFTSASKIKGKVSFNKVDNDKLNIHMIALALTMGNFTNISISDMARDLKLVDKVFAELARQMGCKVGKDKESKEIVLTLTAPLRFPALKKPLKD